MIQIERALSLDDANALIERELQRLNLTAVLQPFRHGDFCNYQCRLYFRETEALASIGFGKGTPEEANLGAKFEALEHYTSTLSHVDIDYHYRSFAELQAQGCQIVASSMPLQILNESQYQQQKLPWLEYTHYRDTNDRVFSPVASVNPMYLLSQKISGDDFPYDEIYMQGTNNGVAIGCDRNEALIHAVSECIERDAFSFLLADNFLLKRRKALRVVDVTTMSAHNQALLQRITDELKLSATVLFMPNIFGVPSFCTCIQDQQFFAPLCGFGASLNAEYALHRSIYECIELLNFYGVHVAEESQDALRTFAKIPALLDCVHFDVQRLIADDNFTAVDFASLTSYTSSDLQTYLEELLDRVFNVGFSVYEKAIYQSDGIYTAHALIPEAENLVGIIKGHIPRFGKRLSAHLQGQTEAESTTVRQSYSANG